MREGQRRALLQLDLDVQPRLVFLSEPASPALEVIDPGFDREEVAAERLDGELALPAVVAEEAHRHAVPLLFAFVPIQQRCGNCIVAVSEHVRFTTTVSPNTRRAGNRPQSTCGVKPSMTTRALVIRLPT